MPHHFLTIVIKLFGKWNNCIVYSSTAESAFNLFYALLLNQRKQRNLEEYKALRHIKPRKDHADALVIRATRAVCARELEAQVKRQSVCEGTAS